MNPDNRIEREPWNRCQSKDMERKGHTHLCRLTHDHTQPHICICSRTWARTKPEAR